MSDLISRQAAIDTALEFIVEYLGGAFDDDFQKKLSKRMLELPSAQPEIIHCKECKHWMREYLDINGKHGCNVMREYTAPNDYCYKAERKEG